MSGICLNGVCLHGQNTNSMMFSFVARHRPELWSYHNTAPRALCDTRLKRIVKDPGLKKVCMVCPSNIVFLHVLPLILVQGTVM